jgi:hypothetical protein
MLSCGRGELLTYMTDHSSLPALRLGAIALREPNAGGVPFLCANTCSCLSLATLLAVIRPTAGLRLQLHGARPTLKALSFPTPYSAAASVTLSVANGMP